MEGQYGTKANNCMPTSGKKFSEVRQQSSDGELMWQAKSCEMGSPGGRIAVVACLYLFYGGLDKLKLDMH